MSIALIVHGGAGAIDPSRSERVQQGCIVAARLGHAILRQGGSALDAVTAAIVALEDDPEFNAGRGSVLTEIGTIELDAGLMEGSALQAGGVIGVTHYANPIRIARAVLESEQVLLGGVGAENLAQRIGLQPIDPATLITAERRQRFEQGRAMGSIDDPSERHGTVGAVAIDQSGQIVAGASTGGVMGKPVGRVGDTPVPGAGYYAENGVGGIACTGNGEGFIRMTIARRTAEYLEHGLTAQDAADRAIALLSRRIQGLGGLIAIDATGRVGWARNTSSMPIAYVMGDMDGPVSAI